MALASVSTHLLIKNEPAKEVRFTGQSGSRVRGWHHRWLLLDQVLQKCVPVLDYIRAVCPVEDTLVEVHVDKHGHAASKQAISVL